MIYYDLKQETARAGIGNAIARDAELKRVARTLKRQYNNNVVVHGASGTGKSALIEGFAFRAAWGEIPGFERTAIAKLETTELKRILSQQNATEAVHALNAAFKNLPNDTIILVDDFHLLANEQRASDLNLAFAAFLERSDLRLVLATSDSGYQMMLRENPNFFQQFEEVHLEETDALETEAIITALSPSFEREYKIAIRPEALHAVTELSAKINSDKKFPLRAIHFLDEVLAHNKITGKVLLEASDVRQIYSEKTGIPEAQLSAANLAMLKNLEAELGRNIIGQGEAIRHIADTVRRSRMGLRNPNRPNGSFLFLGPSGVGKTELSRVLAKSVYGSERSFARIDMSEFSEAHTVQRLVGAPPGYVGFESGGQLTNAVRNQPYSLVLLDEIEKAHPKIFDIFLQVFEDGRLSDGRGQVVNFTNTIVIATSNLGITEIVDAFSRGTPIHEPAFLEQELIPILAKYFRLEFLNRFDAIIIFNPLAAEDLLNIALLEIKKIEARAAEHKVTFNIDPQILRKKIKELSDPRFGARPVKRFIEQTCENLIAIKLMNQAE